MGSTFVRVGHSVQADPRESADSKALAAMAPIMNRVHEGAVRMQAGGEVVNGGPTVYQHTAPTLEGTGSVAATLQGRGPNATVELPGGMRTDPLTAQRMGLIRPDGRGGWEDAVSRP